MAFTSGISPTQIDQVTHVVDPSANFSVAMMLPALVSKTT